MRGYNNEVNMREKYSEVQGRVRELNPKMFYVPWNFHFLNLVFNDSANCYLEAIYIFKLFSLI